MNILIFLLIYVPMPAGRCLSVEGTALLKLKIDGSFINAKVNIRQSNYYIIKSCREYLSTKEHISNDLATAWEFKETEERREMHLSHSTMSEPKNLAPLVTHIGGGTQEHAALSHLVKFHSFSTETWALGPVWMHTDDNFLENWSWTHVSSPRKQKVVNR